MPIILDHLVTAVGPQNAHLSEGSKLLRIGTTELDACRDVPVGARSMMGSDPHRSSSPFIINPEPMIGLVCHRRCRARGDAGRRRLRRLRLAGDILSSPRGRRRADLRAPRCQSSEVKVRA